MTYAALPRMQKDTLFLRLNPDIVSLVRKNYRDVDEREAALPDYFRSLRSHIRHELRARV